MKKVEVSICDYDSVKTKGKAIVCFNTDQLVSNSERIEILPRSTSKYYGHYFGITVEVLRLSCVAGYGNSTEGLYVAEVRKV